MRVSAEKSTTFGTEEKPELQTLYAKLVPAASSSGRTPPRYKSYIVPPRRWRRAIATGASWGTTSLNLATEAQEKRRLILVANPVHLS